MAEREGFEPPCRLPGKTLSRRPRYDHFGTSPFLVIAVRCAFSLVPSAFSLDETLRPQAPRSEKRLYHFSALRFEDTALRFHPVIERRMFVRAHRRLDGACL